MILIVGAGPTGLVLTYWLTRAGVPVRIIDKAAKPGTTSRALAVHARTLEFYRQLDLSDGVDERGYQFDGVNIWLDGKLAGHAEFGAIGQGLTPFPHVLIFPQDEHEQYLIEALQREGVTVDREVELTHFDDVGGHVTATLQHADGSTEKFDADYLVGCDGARSRTRDIAGTGFPGGTYERTFYVANAQVSGPIANGQLNIALDDADFLAVFPLKQPGNVRFIGTVLQSSLDAKKQLTWDDVSPRVIERLNVTVKHVDWFSTYHVHHRVAEHFRFGRVFLAGDAAHIHSPVGGQGMNTGIGDAVNLAWKLAAVTGGASEDLLDTYEPERIAFARLLVDTTDRAFTFSSSGGPLAAFLRKRVLPATLPWLLNRRAMRRLMFRTISQTRVSYRDTGFDAGSAGTMQAGDRLPWVGSEDNFLPLKSRDWQVHVYGTPTAAMIAACAEHKLPLHAFTWRAEIKNTNLRENAAYLVRPDGYVGLADPTPENLGIFVRQWGVKPREPSQT